MTEKLDRLDQLNEKYKNAKFNSIEIALDFSTAKRSAMKARENIMSADYHNESNFINKENNINQNDNYQRENPNMTSSLEEMESLNFNNLMEVLENKTEEILDNQERMNNKALGETPPKRKIKSFGPINKNKEKQEEQKQKRKESKKEKNNNNRSFIKQNIDKNKISEINTKRENIEAKNEDKREWELDNKYKSKTITDFDYKLQNAKLTSLGNKMMNKASMITHTTGRMVEFSIDKDTKLSFEKINGDTYAYKNGKQVDREETVASLKQMLGKLDYNQTRSLEKVINQVAINPAMKDITKDVQEKTAEKERPLSKTDIEK